MKKLKQPKIEAHPRPGSHFEIRMDSHSHSRPRPHFETRMDSHSRPWSDRHLSSKNYSYPISKSYLPYRLDDSLECFGI